MIVCILVYLVSFHHFLTLVYYVQGIVLLIILISGLMCMMGIDTPSRFEAPQESWLHFNAGYGSLSWQGTRSMNDRRLLVCTVDIVSFLFQSALCIVLSQLLFTMCSILGVIFYVDLAELLQTNTCVRLVLYQTYHCLQCSLWITWNSGNQ
jgi:hypothetical protein